MTQIHNSSRGRTSACASRPMVRVSGTVSDSHLWRNFVDEDDVESLAKLFDQKKEILHSIACRVVGNKSDADDVIQTSIEHLLAAKPNAKVQSWLVGIVLNQARMYVRRESRLRGRHERGCVDEKVVENPTDRFEKNEMSALVTEIIRELPVRYRDPVVLHYIEGLKFHDIAEALERKEETVKKQSQRGIAMMRTLMFKRGVTASAIMIGSWLGTLHAAGLEDFSYNEMPPPDCIPAAMADADPMHSSSALSGVSAVKIATVIMAVSAAAILSIVVIRMWADRLVHGAGEEKSAQVALDIDELRAVIKSTLEAKYQQPSAISLIQEPAVGVGGKPFEDIDERVDKEDQLNKEQWQNIPYQDLACCPFGVIEDMSEADELDLNEGENIWLVRPRGSTYPTVMLTHTLKLPYEYTLHYEIQERRVQSSAYNPNKRAIHLGYVRSSRTVEGTQWISKPSREVLEQFRKTSQQWHSIDVEARIVDPLNPEVREISYFVDGELYWSVKTTADQGNLFAASVSNTTMAMKNWKFVELAAK